MKIYSWLGIAILGIGLVAVVSVINQIAKQAEAENQQDLDDWMNDRIAKALERKLNEPSDSILQVLRGSVNSQLAAQIQRTVHSVTLSVTRKSSGSNVQVRLEMSYADGTSFSATTEREWDRLPGSIREQFLRTGVQVVRFPWNFPGIEQIA